MPHSLGNIVNSIMKLLLALLSLAIACQTNSDYPSCQHKSLFPLSPWEFLCLSCGVAAGVGGSLIVFPLWSSRRLGGSEPVID